MQSSLPILRAFLRSLSKAVTSGRVRFTTYAREGLGELGWEEFDAHAQMLELTEEDFYRCEESRESDEIIWVFTPEYWEGGTLWIRMVERRGIIVISFHRG